MTDKLPETLDPPTHRLGMLRFAGPGMIVAGSIVGSGELIATTKTGAEAGFLLLWLILLGCVVKVFAQVEFGRYALSSGKTTLDALSEVPGPRIAGRGNWLVWFWFAMWFASIGQLGGIVGGVGQSLAISIPLTAQGALYNEAEDARISQRLMRVRSIENAQEGDETAHEAAQAEALSAEYAEQYGATQTADVAKLNPPPDAKIWAAIVAVITCGLLVVGRYRMIQSLSITLVTGFTLLTIYNLFKLQAQPDWSVKSTEFLSGLRFSLPEKSGGVSPLVTALATFGIIGVGAAELIVYPYWCLEKGYGRFTGPRDETPQWQARAKGWMKVMRLDAWGSMIVYTFSTMVFYLLGAATLHRADLNPSKDHMVRTLATMFHPVFGNWASMLFLFGAFAVLYSTYFVANASHARTFSDAIRVMGFIRSDEATQRRWVRILSGLFPMLCLVLYLLYPNPVHLVLLSGLMQGLMLPMLGGAALYFRYRRSIPGLEPGLLWDHCLWLSVFAMYVTGIWTIYSNLF
ncbi:Nramp family divalent metal transporter [Rosistilla oblonga]|uniref:Manganese transport protein MntH n=1 Tax=Rosistilla oblonga TaxID=2527990 RepID=A0A518IQR1_9BACT|nr:Nramp family divalent metal transporter [Rosistilla oblonga]QDV55431.1 manganese transport protein MntH [Rosistilla oblonga]